MHAFGIRSIAFAFSAVQALHKCEENRTIYLPRGSKRKEVAISEESLAITATCL
jgi:hypothetical protein